MIIIARMLNTLRPSLPNPLRGSLMGFVRCWMTLLVIGMLAAGEADPRSGADDRGTEPFTAQVNHALVGALGKPFPIGFHLYGNNGQGFTYEGDIVDAAGNLAVTGKWDLILEEILEGKIVASHSLKPDGAAGVVAPVVKRDPYSQNRKWTWDARAVLTRAGNYRLHLRYGDHVFSGEQFRMDETLDPPPWIEVTVTPDKTRAVMGEPVMVTVRVRNNGKDSYPATFGGDYRGASRALRFFCLAKRTDGAVGWDPEPLQNCMGGIAEFGPLEPGNERKRDIVLGAYVRCPGPGTYRITVCHALGFGTPLPGIDGKGLLGFTRFAKAGEFTLELVEPASGDAERIINTALGAREDYDRARRLGHLHEPFFLEPLQETLARAAQHGEELVDGIDSIRTTAATAVLIDLLDHPDAKTRTRAMTRLRFRLPQPDWFRNAKMSPEQVELQEFRKTLVVQTWSDELAGRLQAKLKTVMAGSSAGTAQEMIDLLGMVGKAETAEEIALMADRLGADAATIQQNSTVMNRLENASYTLGLRGIAPCRIDEKSSPGRLICWARMREGGQLPSTPQVDALLMKMVVDPSADVREAALRGMTKDAGARLPLPWKALFMDDGRSVFHLAAHLSEQAPKATIAPIVRECLQQDPKSDRRSFLEFMLKHLESDGQASGMPTR